MKSYTLMIFILLSCLPIAGQQAFDEYPSPRYLLISGVDEATTQTLVRQLESLHSFFNSYFHINPASNDKLRVRLYQDRMSYNNYLQATIDTTRGGYTYLHYGMPQRNELVGFMSRDPEVQKTFVRQAFIQFIRDAVPNTPVWIREGFAIYFEKINFDEFNNTRVVFSQGTDWAESLRKIVQDTDGRLPFTLRNLIQADKTFVNQYADVFYPVAWGFISFLLESDNKAYNRFLWESLASMQEGYSYEENVHSIFQNSFVWLNETELSRDFLSYVENIKTYSILIEEGIQFYQSGQLEAALGAFKEASDMEPTNYVSFYYRGLINYNLGQYNDAGRLFLQSQNRGLAEDLAHYAVGLNAYAQGDLEETRYHLRLIPFESSYFLQAEQLLNEMPAP